jgi:hypothetical protein
MEDYPYEEWVPARDLMPEEEIKSLKSRGVSSLTDDSLVWVPSEPEMQDEPYLFVINPETNDWSRYEAMTRGLSEFGLLNSGTASSLEETKRFLKVRFLL